MPGTENAHRNSTGHAVLVDGRLERPRLPALTSIRFLAALWVALFHMQAMKAFSFSSTAVRHLAGIGYSGVSFFFVLSGFILVYTYAGRPVRARVFWQARFARIYPALLFALLVAGPSFFYCCMQMRAHNPRVSVPEWAWSAAHLPLTIGLSLTLLESWVPQTALAWNMPNWSLSVEAFFYCLFPFLLPRMARLSRGLLLLVLPAGWLLLVACGLLYTHYQPDGPIGYRTLGPWMNTLKYNPLVRLPEFVMGMAAGLLFLRNPESGRNRKLAWPLVGAGLVAIAVVTVWSNAIPYVVIHTAVLAPAFAALIYGLALRPQGGLGLLEHPVMELLGEASYAFYLLHAFLLAVFFLDFETGQAKHQTALGFCTWLLLAVGVSLLVDRFLERPLRRLLRPRRDAAVAAGAVPAAAAARA